MVENGDVYMQKLADMVCKQMEDKICKQVADTIRKQVEDTVSREVAKALGKQVVASEILVPVRTYTLTFGVLKHTHTTKIVTSLVSVRQRAVRCVLVYLILANVGLCTHCIAIV